MPSDKIKIPNSKESDYAGGNVEYLKDNSEIIFNILKAITHEINSDGSYSFDKMFFIDWSSNSTPDQNAGFNAMLVLI